MNRMQVAKIWLIDDAIWLELKDGRRAQELFSNYSRLAKAGDAQRNNYILSHFGIHWPDIDEYLSYAGFLTSD